MITNEQLQLFEQRLDANPANAIAMNAVVHNGVVKSAISYEAFRQQRHEFSVNIKTGEITNQKASGRCWMFAALNVMRFEVMEKLKLESFEFSQSYPLFFDKLEKANYFLENILDTLDEPTGGRLVSFLLTDPMGDGGQWDMFCGLVEKYGRRAKRRHAGIQLFLRHQGNGLLPDAQAAGIRLHAAHCAPKGSRPPAAA